MSHHAKDILELRVRNAYKDRVLELRVAELQKVHESLADQSRKLQKLQETNDNLLISCALKDKELACKEQECEDLKLTLVTAESNTKAVDELTELLTSVVNDRNVFAEQLNTVKLEVSEQVSVLSTHLSIANAKLDERETRVKELEELLSDSRVTVQALSGDHHSLNSDCEVMEKRTKELEEIVSALRKDVSERISDLADADIKASCLSEEIKLKDIACEKLENKIQCLEAIIAADSVSFTEMVEKIKRLENTLANNVTDCSASDSIVKDMSSSIIEKNAKIEKLQRLVQEKEIENQQKESALSHLALAKDELEEERINLVLTASQLTDDITDLKEKLMSEKETVRELCNKIERLNEDLAGLTTTSRELSREICRLEACLQQESASRSAIEIDFSAKIDELSRCNVELSDEVRVLSTELALQCSNTDIVDNARERDETELTLCQRELTLCQLELEKCRASFAQCQKEVAQSHVDLVHCRRRLAECDRESRNVTNELAQCRSELEEEQRQKLSLLSEVEVLGCELTRCQGDACSSSQMSDPMPSSSAMQSQPGSQFSLRGLEVAALQAEKGILEAKLQKDSNRLETLESDVSVLRGEREELQTRVVDVEAELATKLDDLNKQQDRIDTLLLESASKDKITNALRLRLASEKCRREQLLAQLSAELDKKRDDGNEIQLKNVAEKLCKSLNEQESSRVALLENINAGLRAQLERIEDECMSLHCRFEENASYVEHAEITSNVEVKSKSTVPAVCWDDSENSSEGNGNWDDISEDVRNGRIFVPESPEIKASRCSPARTFEFKKTTGMQTACETSTELSLTKRNDDDSFMTAGHLEKKRARIELFSTESTNNRNTRLLNDAKLNTEISMQEMSRQALPSFVHTTRKLNGQQSTTLTSESEVLTVPTTSAWTNDANKNDSSGSGTKSRCEGFVNVTVPQRTPVRRSLCLNRSRCTPPSFTSKAPTL